MDQQQVPAKAGMSTGVKVLIGCGVLIVLSIICAVLASVMGLMGASKVINEVNNEIEKQEKVEHDKFNSPKSINEEIVISDIKWQLTEAKDLGTTLKSNYGEYGDDCIANSGKFIMVKVQVTNNSSEMKSLMNLNLYDSLEREFYTSSEVYSCIEDELFILDNINPGITKDYVAVYEVPSDSTDLRIKVGDLEILGDEYEYILLGL